MKVKYNRAKEAVKKNPNVPSKKLTLQTLRKKLVSAESYLNRLQPGGIKIKKLKRQSLKVLPSQRTVPATKPTTEKVFIKLNGTESKSELVDQINAANKKVIELEEKLKDQQKLSLDAEIKHLKLIGKFDVLESHNFTYHNLIISGKLEYLSGLSKERFDIILECLRPYLHLLSFAERQVSEKLFNIETQLLAVLTICRHGLDLKFMAYIMKCSETTVQRLFKGWTIFTATVFNRIDLCPGHGFLLQKMPEEFVITSHGFTDLIIDATEFKFQCATNYEDNSLMFSNYLKQEKL